MDVALVLQLLLKFGPDVYKVARKLLSKPVPSEADWAELDAILEKTGESYFAPIPVGSTAGAHP